MKPINEKVVLVTGASSGIGAATVRRLVKAGAFVALAARRADKLAAVRRDVDPDGGRTLELPGDVTVENDRLRWVALTLQRFGRIDALVNNAGYGQRGPVEQVPLEAIRRNFETNVFALIGLTQKVIPVMRQQGGGCIVNVGSVAGRIARPLTSVYDSTKHALEGFTDGLRGELKPFGIDVVLVRPGFISSEFGEAADKASGDFLAGPGVYGEFARSFKGGAQRLKRIAGHPDQVARVVAKALAVRHPRSHYAAPAHAKFFLFLKWLLPVRALDWAVRLRR